RPPPALCITRPGEYGVTGLEQPARRLAPKSFVRAGDQGNSHGHAPGGGGQGNDKCQPRLTESSFSKVLGMLPIQRAPPLTALRNHSGACEQSYVSVTSVDVTPSGMSS